MKVIYSLFSLIILILVNGCAQGNLYVRENVGGFGGDVKLNALVVPTVAANLICP